MLVFAAIVPHPPLSIPGIGTQDNFDVLKGTLGAYEALRLELETARPDVIIMISPHGYMEEYSFVINSAPVLAGDFSDFSSTLGLTFKNDLDLVDKICKVSELNGIATKLHPSFLDHGSLVPLFHLTKNIHPKLLHLSFSFMTLERHYRYGEIISNLIEKEIGLRVAVIASGDLSHKLTLGAPAGFSPLAAEFDRTLIRHLSANNVERIIGMETHMSEGAGECGLRSITLMLGTLFGKKIDFKLLSYEHPFGIGYLTARLL